MAETNGMVVYQRDQDTAESDVWDDTALIQAYNKAINDIKAQVEDKEESEQSQSSEFSKRPKKKNKNKRPKKNKNKSKKGQWNVGDECQAIFTEDGLIYNASIISINYAAGTCDVYYTDYGNEEEQYLNNLLPPAPKVSNSDTKMDSSECGSNHPSQHSYPQHKKNSSKHSKSSSRRQSNFNPNPQYGMPSFPGAPNFLNGMYFYPSNNMPSPASMGLPLIPPPPPPTVNESMNSNEALCSMLMSWYMSGYHTGYYQGLSHSQKNSKQ